MKKSFPHYKQLDQMDCGPTCLRIIAKHYGKHLSADRVRKESYVNKDGVTLLGLSYAFESLGLKTVGTKLTTKQLIEDAPLPCVVPWNNNHFVVVYKIKQTLDIRRKIFGIRGNIGKSNVSSLFYVSNPAGGKEVYNEAEFINHWKGGEEKGFALLCEPTPDFYGIESHKDKESFSYFFRYLKPHKNLYIQIFFAMLFGSLTALILPFLTQSVVDIGISNKNLEFIYLVLAAQLMFTFGSVITGYIQSWIGLHVGTRVSISFLSDFLTKLLKLPYTFFETRTIGDILQRISDNSRVQSFVSSVFFTIIFSLLNFVLYSFILSYYSIMLFIVFMLGNILFGLWIFAFMKKRREFDKKSFELGSENETQLVQLIQNIPDIKVNNLERSKRWEWERLQAKGYKLSMKMLVWGQFQASGSLLINSVKNILLSIISAKAVIDGQMTLGMMLSVQYIIGQLQAPISAFIGLVHQYQDAKISIERLGEILAQDNEETKSEEKINFLPESESIVFENVYFRYGGLDKPYVLKNLNFAIPKGKTTAIVGKSGSGKTTILKLLLKFYEPTEGHIRLGNYKLSSINNSFWREKCGAVLQESSIFNDSIENNIVLDNYLMEPKKLYDAILMSNLQDVIENLPQGTRTKIGQEGVGLSGGQIQRILIARTIYKNPEYLFFDEATSALDAENEQTVQANLMQYFKDKTVIIVAHRLSTVVNADQIIVLNNGEIAEIGNHETLFNQQGVYYQLVKSQMAVFNG